MSISYESRILKTWQGNDLDLIMQVQTPKHLLDQLPKKIFLVSNTNQQKRGFKLLTTKPKNIKPQGTLANIIRKYMPTTWLSDVIEDQHQNYWAVFKRGNTEAADWYILLERCAPPLMHFISGDKTTFFRYGKQGTYTKKQTFQNDFPATEEKSILKSLFSEVIAHHSAIQDDLDSIEDTEISVNEEPDQDDQIKSSFQNESKKRLKRRFKTALKAIEKQIKNTPSNDDIQLLETKARLLQQYSYKIKGGDLSVTLFPEETGLDKSITIDLNPDIKPGQNLDEVFIEVKRLKRAKVHGEQLRQRDQKYIDQLKGDIELFEENILEDHSIVKILEKYNLAAKKQIQNVSNQKNASVKPYREFKDSNQTLYWVGKGSAENDEMVKKAKSNDFWFHIIGTTGSHVIIPAKSIKGKSPDQNQTRKAAILATHFSKLRNNGSADVYFTQKQHIKKKKGMPPGLWNVEKSETIFVSYQEDELKEVLNMGVF